MRRILIADESDILVQIIAKECFADDEVCSCANGKSALNLLAEFLPDILLINMSLPYKDGLSVLREAAYLPQQVIAFCYATNPFIVHALGLLGVQYVLHMPTAAGVRQALAAMENARTGVRADLRQRVIEHLRRLGIPTHLDGYRMLVVGLPLLFRDPTQPLEKELYPAIVCALGSGTTKTVEHSIRQAIIAGWNARTDEVWRQYFPHNAAGQISCPNNKRFLTAVLCNLQQEAEIQKGESV